jgi:AcrR family transcriptional regulator
VRREAEILAAAERLFSENGYHAVGVDAIGQAAGISGSAIYRHFAGKDEILSALFDQAIDELLDRIGEPAQDQRIELERLVTAHLDFTVERRRLAIIWQQDQRSLSDASQRGLARRQRRYGDRWLHCLERCYPALPRDDLVVAMRATQALLMSIALPPAHALVSPRVRALIKQQGLASLEGLEAGPGIAVPTSTT